MSTKHYGFPEIDPAAQFDGANDINELADAIDTAMKQVETLGKGSTYTLPAATALKLGGVRIGDNVSVSADGTISTSVDPYELPAASHTTLGGVIVPDGSGISLDADGTISIDDKSVTVPDGSVTASKLADGSVTASKLANGSVTYEKLGSSLKTAATNAETIYKGDWMPVTESHFTRLLGDANTLKVYKFATWIVLKFEGFTFELSESSTSFNLLTFGSSYAPESDNTDYYESSCGFVPYKSGDVTGSLAVLPSSIAGVRGNTLVLSAASSLTAGTYSIDGACLIPFVSTANV